MSPTGPITPTFRPASPDDADAIAAYHRRCWILAFEPLLEQDVESALTPARVLASWRERLDPGSGLTTVVATVDGDVVGHTSVRDHEIVNVFVDPDRWGRGIGRALVGVAEALVAEAGHTEAELHTIVGNEPALALYRSTGWTVTERLVRTDRTDGLVLVEHVLRKRLGPLTV